ncbi:MAG: FecR domain-containing protein [Chloroflexi bacterium]|nr:FecR domain-containing protein [Chloroflexota bacterium]
MRKLAVLLLVVVVAFGAFVAFAPKSAVEAVNNAVLAVLNPGVDAQRTGDPDFGPAFDGDVFATGDVVRSNDNGRAVLTFFDGSTISVDPKSRVRVVSLTKLADGGIQLLIEQTAGRTWTSVSKLASPQSKFEIKTPSLTATVRGTAFETIIETINGVATTTIKTSEGEVVAQAVAGGQVSIGAGQQAAVQEGQPAPPTAQPQPPTPRLRFTAPAGAGFTVIDPRGFQCGTGAALRQIPRCEVTGQTIVIGDVVAGTYSLMVTAAQPIADASVVADGLGVQATDFSTKFTRALKVGDLIRTTLPVALAGGKMSSGGFTPAELVTSVCGAEATGRVFSGGTVDERSAQLVQYGKLSRGEPAAVVVTGKEITDIATLNASSQGLPVSVSDVTCTPPPRSPPAPSA